MTQVKIITSKYTPKLIHEAYLVAVKAHGNQSYDEIFPYEKHLNDVVNILRRFNYLGIYEVVGYLHDSIEDGNISYNKLKNYFGEEVAEMVYALTDELGRNRKEKKEKTYLKLRQNRKATVVKVADRIANIEHGGKVDMYKKEYAEFKSAIFIDNTCDDLWSYLDSLMGE